MGALDLLAEQGQWSRCIDKAKNHPTPILHKYVALYAAKLLKDGLITEALNLYTTHGAPPIPQNFNIYNHIATEMFSLSDLSGPDSYDTWEQLRKMLLEVVSNPNLIYKLIYFIKNIGNFFVLQNEGLATLSNGSAETKMHFNKLLLISHYYSLRAACRQVLSLKSIGVKISTALLRYTDIIPADKAFYEAGKNI